MHSINNVKHTYNPLFLDLIHHASDCLKHQNIILICVPSILNTLSPRPTNEQHTHTHTHTLILIIHQHRDYTHKTVQTVHI